MRQEHRVDVLYKKNLERTEELGNFQRTFQLYTYIYIGFTFTEQDEVRYNTDN